MTFLDTAQTHPGPSLSPLQSARRWYRNWLARRQIRRLADYNTRMLTDMGVTRDEVLWAAQLPISVNAAWELRSRSRSRRLAEKSIS